MSNLKIAHRSCGLSGVRTRLDVSDPAALMALLVPPSCGTFIVRAISVLHPAS